MEGPSYEQFIGRRVRVRIVGGRTIIGTYRGEGVIAHGFRDCRSECEPSQSGDQWPISEAVAITKNTRFTMELAVSEVN